MFAATRYAGIPKDLIRLLKFGRAKEAAETIAQCMFKKIAPPFPGTIIVPVPTATKRVRSRGYDQAALIAKALAKYTDCAYASLLMRQGQNRQVGQGREDRKIHTGMNFRVTPKKLPKHRPILLIDDVITTGSTLEAAAGVLSYNGFTQIEAAVFAAA